MLGTHDQLTQRKHLNTGGRAGSQSPGETSRVGADDHCGGKNTKSGNGNQHRTTKTQDGKGNTNSTTEEVIKSHKQQPWHHLTYVSGSLNTKLEVNTNVLFVQHFVLGVFFCPFSFCEMNQDVVVCELVSSWHRATLFPNVSDCHLITIILMKQRF